MVQKITDEGFIVGLVDGAQGTHGVEVTEQEYTELTDLFHNMPTPREGYEYKLTINREWVEVPIDTDPDLVDAEALEILLGGGSE